MMMRVLGQRKFVAMQTTMGSRRTQTQPPGPGMSSSHVLPSTAWFGPTVPRGTAKELMAFLGSHDGVAVVHWPRDVGIVRELARSGLPRLLLVANQSDAPPYDGLLQDWLLWPASEEATHDRLMTLSRRSAEHRVAAGLPTVDDRGRVRRGDDYVELSAFEHPLAEALVARFEEPVTESDLLAIAGRPSVSRTCLRVRLSRLSEDVNPLGLEVVSISGAAYSMRRCISLLDECAA